LCLDRIPEVKNLPLVIFRYDEEVFGLVVCVLSYVGELSVTGPDKWNEILSYETKVIVFLQAWVPTVPSRPPEMFKANDLQFRRKPWPVMEGRCCGWRTSGSWLHVEGIHSVDGS
jgi:hypothetical protein